MYDISLLLCMKCFTDFQNRCDVRQCLFICSDQAGDHRRQSLSCCLESTLLQTKSHSLRQQNDQSHLISAHRDIAAAQNYQQLQQLAPAVNTPIVDHSYLTDQSLYLYHQQLLQQQQQQQQLNYLYGSGMAVRVPTVDNSRSQLIESSVMLLQQQQEHQKQLRHHYQLTAPLQQEQRLRMLIQQQQIQQQVNPLGFIHFQPYFPVSPNNFALCFNHQ